MPGIGSVQVFGAGQYAMRLWVKPDQLAKLAITVPEIVTAIQAQNTVNPAGQIGGEPVPQGQEFTYTVRAQGRLDIARGVRRDRRARKLPTAASFASRTSPASSWARRTTPSPAASTASPSAIIAVYQLPGSNAVDAADGVKKLLAEAEAALSAGRRLRRSRSTPRAP